MATAQRPKVMITKEQFDDYVSLVRNRNGKLGSEAILQIQQKYNLPKPHTRQAVILRLRQKEKEEGIEILPKRKRRSDVMPGAKRTPPELSLDEGIEIMLTAFERARKYPELEAELEKCKLDCANLKEKLRQQEESEKKRHGQAMRFKLAQQHEGINKLKKQKVVSH